MNDIKNDNNLREAINRREQQLEPMPADLNERLMLRIGEQPVLEQPETKTKHRVLWAYGAGIAAVAAGILLLVLFNFRQMQQEPTPVVAQQTMSKPLVAKSQPVVDKQQPEAEASNQSAQQPVEQQAEAESQTADPAPAEDAEKPHYYNPQAIPDITSPRDELFLTSTSGMTTNRSYNDGLATYTAHEESEDNDLNVRADKNKGRMPEGWKDLKSWSNDHKLNRNLTKKERKQLAVANAVADRQWHIDIQSMNTMRYGARTVTTDFFLELRGDTLRSYLPYLGQAQVSPSLSPSIGLNFEERIILYKESRPKSKYTQIDIDVKTHEDSYHYVVELYDSGSASIRVRSLNRDPISFDGSLDITY